jgi:hypothetical protein
LYEKDLVNVKNSIFCSVEGISQKTKEAGGGLHVKDCRIILIHCYYNAECSDWIMFLLRGEEQVNLWLFKYTDNNFSASHHFCRTKEKDFWLFLDSFDSIEVANLKGF